MLIIELHSAVCNFVICHLHKEQRQQFAVSSKRKLFYLCILLSGSEMSHITQTGAAIFNLSGRQAESVSHRDEMSSALIHEKIKAQSDSLPLYYRAYSEHLSLSNPPFKKKKKKMLHVCVGETSLPHLTLWTEISMETMWPFED